MVVERDPNDPVGRGERHLDSLGVARFGAQADIVPVPDPGRIRRRRRARIGYRREGFVGDRDPFQRIECGLPRFRHREGDDLADVADPVGSDRQRLGQRRQMLFRKSGFGGVQMIGGCVVLEEARKPVRRVVVPGQHRQDAGRRGGIGHVDFENPGMRVRRAQKRGVRLTGRVEIVAEPPPAGKKPAVFPPGDPFADRSACHTAPPAPALRPPRSPPARRRATAGRRAP